jgi:N-carbamoyl-L-amino-acid hydrolase
VRGLRDRSGVTFADAARAAGFDPALIGRDDQALARIGCFVELHVEQGRGLADLGQPVAIASRIIAHGRWRVTLTGHGNHAGTTLLPDRRDPVVAAARLILAVRDCSARAGARGTVGRIEVVPGGTNVIAGTCRAWVDVRIGQLPDVEAVLAQIIAEAERAARDEGCEIAVATESVSGDVLFDLDLSERLGRILPDAPRLETGAGHDAGILASVAPTAMLFVRSPDGASHGPTEFAAPADALAGVHALDLVLRDLVS